MQLLLSLATLSSREKLRTFHLLKFRSTYVLTLVIIKMLTFYLSLTMT